MPTTYLKRATATGPTADDETTALGKKMLRDIEENGEEAVARYAAELDGWTPESFVVTEAQIEQAAAALSPQTRADIDFSLNQVSRFAAAQRATLQDLEIELSPGLTAGHRHVPVEVAGCYIPGGRYSHAA